jgi:hypothetical protein
MEGVQASNLQLYINLVIGQKNWRVHVKLLRGFKMSRPTKQQYLWLTSLEPPVSLMQNWLTLGLVTANETPSKTRTRYHRTDKLIILQYTGTQTFAPVVVTFLIS